MKMLLFLVLLLAADGGEKFLADILLYQKDSYFKQQVYREHNWQSFYALKEANEVVVPDNYDLHLLNAAIFFSTNKLRTEKKLPPLKFSDGLRVFNNSQNGLEKMALRNLCSEALKTKRCLCHAMPLH